MEEQKAGRMKTLIMMITMIGTLTGCTYTYTFSQVQTDGKAEDVIDETSTVTPSNSVSVPINVAP
jgi:hypothetical protein